MQLSPNPYQYVSDDLGLPEFESREVQIFVPKYNSPHKRADATGAFHPGAISFARVHGIPRSNIHYIDNRRSKSNMRSQLLDKMKEVKEGVSTWVFFCHGYTHGIQFGLRSSNHPRITEDEEKDFQHFCEIIASSHPAPMVILYACSTGDDPDDDPDSAPGSGDGCFGDLLRDNISALWGVFCIVWTHTTAGHSFFNPNVKPFIGTGRKEGAVGAKPLFIKGSREFRLFARELPSNPDTAGSFWARFPFIPIDKLRSRYSLDKEDS